MSAQCVTCRYLSLPRLEAAIPKVLKPSEISHQREKAAAKMRKLQRVQEAADAAAASIGMSVKRAAELEGVKQQLAALQEEQDKLQGLATTFTEDEMKRTPLPRFLTPTIMSVRYCCEFGLPIKDTDLHEAQEQVKQNAVEVGDHGCP